MKKKIVFLAVVSITIAACNPLKPDKSKSMETKFNVSDSIPSKLAEDMITHYLDSVQVDHRMNTIINQISLYNSDLYEIFKNDKITRIRLLTAAYLHTDEKESRRDSVTVLLQLKVGYNSDYYYYDVQSLGAGRLCPPPNGCSTY